MLRCKFSSTFESRKVAQGHIDKWIEKSKTMIFATHDPEWSLSYCSRLLLLNNRILLFDQATNEIDINKIIKILR